LEIPVTQCAEEDSDDEEDMTKQIDRQREQVEQQQSRLQDR